MVMKKEFKIGIFSLSILVLSFFMLNYFGGKDIYNKEINIYSMVDELERLTPSASVFFKGATAGKVSNIEYITEENRFKVTYSIKKEYRLPIDSRFVITGIDIMGTKGVQIELGSLSEYAEDGAYLVSEVRPDLITEMSGKISPVLTSLNQTLLRLDTIAININSLFSEENKFNINQTISKINSTVSEIESFSQEINSNSKDISNFITDLKSLSSQLLVISNKADDTVDEITDISQSINKADVEGVINSLSSLLEKVQDPDGSLGRFINEDEVYEGVDKLILDIDSLVTEIKKNPKKYIKITIF